MAFIRDLGLPLTCLDARQAKEGLSVQVNKTDENNALGLAQFVWAGWYREVKVKSLYSHLVRGVLGARAQLVSTWIHLTTMIRSLFNNVGVFVAIGHRQTFACAAEEAIGTQTGLAAMVAPLIAAWRAITEQIRAYDGLLRRRAANDETTRRLMTVPGVGPIVALAFASMVDEPGRLAKSKSVGAYHGLTPRRYQSEEKDVTGSISRLVTRSRAPTCSRRLTYS